MSSTKPPKSSLCWRTLVTMLDSWTNEGWNSKKVSAPCVCDYSIAHGCHGGDVTLLVCIPLAKHLSRLMWKVVPQHIPSVVNFRSRPKTNYGMWKMSGFRWLLFSSMWTRNGHCPHLNVHLLGAKQLAHWNVTYLQVKEHNNHGGFNYMIELTWKREYLMHIQLSKEVFKVEIPVQKHFQLNQPSPCILLDSWNSRSRDFAIHTPLPRVLYIIHSQIVASHVGYCSWECRTFRRQHRMAHSEPLC